MYVRIISALEMLACRHEPILAMHVGVTNGISNFATPRSSDQGAWVPSAKIKTVDSDGCSKSTLVVQEGKRWLSS